MGRYWANLKYILIHKYWVFLAGWELGVPWLALLHDNSKFLPTEWFCYARHFYEANGSKRTRMSGDGFYTDPKNDLAFDRAWLIHIKRNKHHPQHWVDVTWTPCGHNGTAVLLKDDGQAKCLEPIQGRDWRDRGRSNGEDGRDRVCGHRAPYHVGGSNFPVAGFQILIHEMPERYRLEMVADWMGAGRAQGTPDTLKWYTARGKGLPLGPETRSWVEDWLGYQAPNVETSA